jgi:hypothetical protein
LDLSRIAQYYGADYFDGYKVFRRNRRETDRQSLLLEIRPSLGITRL